MRSSLAIGTMGQSAPIVGVLFLCAIISTLGLQGGVRHRVASQGSVAARDQTFALPHERTFATSVIVPKLSLANGPRFSWKRLE